MMKILFLAANPIDAVTRLRMDLEIREIKHKIRMGPYCNQLAIDSELAVRADDLQAALLWHKPDVVHFSGHCSQASGIMLEDEAGNHKEVSREALCDLFTVLKKNIRVVVLNACYAKDQAEALATMIDFTIGMSAEIEDKDAITFAAYFYQGLAFGCSVKEAFDLAVTQLKLEGSSVADVPVLIERRGASAPVPLAESYSRLAFLPWLFGGVSVCLITDVLRRFVDNDGGWLGVASTMVQAVFIALATLIAFIAGISMLRPTSRFARVAANIYGLNRSRTRRMATILTGTAFVATVGLWLSLPAIAHYYNEMGIAFHYSDPPDLSRARQSYQRAVRLNPSYAQARYNLALVQEDLEPEKAIEEYLIAIRHDSHFYPAYNNLARLYIRRAEGNDYENALSILNKAVDLSPQDENVQYSLNKNLGWANLALMRYSVAEMYLRRAISLRSQGGAAAHCLLAYVLIEQGRAEEAADECFDCVSLAPGENDVEARWRSDAQEFLTKVESE